MSKEKLLNSYNRKNDEFYTLYDDIASELPNYREQLKGKRIICPCDWDESLIEEIVYSDGDYVPAATLLSKGDTIKDINIPASLNRIEKSLDLVKCNFVKFLVAHAEAYGIKSISVSGYNPATNEGIRFQDIDYTKYDVVVTNPPFSLFREFVDTMFSNNMKFIIIGPQNAITYKETFEYIKDNRLWLGYHHHLTGFILPDGTILKKNDALPRCCCWFTNLDVKYRHDKLILTENYTPERFPRYYNYNGIDVNETKSIPYDFYGHMGVPITFLQKYNPEQFEIIGKGVQVEKTKRFKGDKATLWIEKDGKPYRAPFERIIIRNKDVYINEN